MRLAFIEPAETKGTLRSIFRKLIMVPNVLCLMGNSEAALESYAHFHANQPTYKLSAKLRKVISLAVSEYNKCSYCVALHTSTAIDSNLLTKEECLDSRKMESANHKTHQLLRFTREVLEHSGNVSDNALGKMKRCGFDDQEIIELISVVSFITMANITANVGQPELDFLEPPLI